MGENTGKAKGKIERVAGRSIGDEKLERQGKRDEAKGRVQGAVDEVKGKAKDVKTFVEKPKK
jgi:uncharacterized protein YjbJ (UPF0337 family)